MYMEIKIFRVLKSRRLQWGRCVGQNRDEKYIYGVVSGKPTGRPIRVQEVNIKVGP
jgi:hypothetical protein